MVQLPGPSGQAGRAVGVRSHHNWGARFGRRRDELKCRGEPTTVSELDSLAKRTVEVMDKHAPESEHHYEKAMDLLRQQYNLNFMIVCDGCHKVHLGEENLAPER